MKQFIVFLAMLIVFVSSMVFVTDSNNYLRLQKHLKAMAEEAASGAILMKDKELSQSQGRYVLNLDAADKYIAHIVEDAVFNSNIALLDSGSLSWDASTVPAVVLPASNAAIRVTVYWEGKKLFRLFSFPPLVSQSAIYETKIK